MCVLPSCGAGRGDRAEMHVAGGDPDYVVARPNDETAILVDGLEHAAHDIAVDAYGHFRSEPGSAIQPAPPNIGQAGVKVVGVIANLAVFFALHTLFDQTHDVDAGPIHLDVPALSSWDPVAFAITAVALAAMYWRRWSPLRTLGLCAALGLVVFGVQAVS